MKVSIITISYNSESTIKDTIKSVLSQDYPNIEYIVVDGKSSDKTVSIIQNSLSSFLGEGKGEVKFISEKDNGIYDAMNKGISLATGDIIGVLNSDDFYADEKIISKIVNLFQSKNCDAVYGNLLYVSKDNSKTIRHWKSGEYKEGMFLKGWMPPHPTFFVKKECYDKFGKFNLQFTSAADYELMLRFIHKHKIKVAYLPEVIVKMRVGGKSNVTFANRIKANMEDRLAWKVNGLKPNIFTLFLKPLSKLKQFLLR